jgi:hypothetical protein
MKKSNLKDLANALDIACKINGVNPISSVIDLDTGEQYPCVISIDEDNNLLIGFSPSGDNGCPCCAKEKENAKS